MNTTTHPHCPIGVGAEHPRHAFQTFVDGGADTVTCGGFEEPAEHRTPRPVCTVLEAANSLGKLSEARTDLTADEGKTLAFYVLGHVSSYVPPTVWDAAITQGCLHIARQRDQREQRSVAS